jgi:hypothetical protein
MSNLKWNGKPIIDLSKIELIAIITALYNKGFKLDISIQDVGKQLYEEADKTANYANSDTGKTPVSFSA